ncbi:MAG: DNA translocase FtsK [Anaerolineae bacterium]
MPEAIALVRQLRKASTSLLQRRFRIGYTRAARMIDAMEEQGIIGPPTGTSKAREVMLPPENEEETEEEMTS